MATDEKFPKCAGLMLQAPLANFPSFIAGKISGQNLKFGSWLGENLGNGNLGTIQDWGTVPVPTIILHGSEDGMCGQFHGESIYN